MPLGTSYIPWHFAIILAGSTCWTVWGLRGFGGFAVAALLLGGLNDLRERRWD